MRWVLLLLAMTTFAHADPRTELAAKLGRVKAGMTTAQVTKILGAPDDVLTDEDPGGITAARTVEVWRYGASGHLMAATLGTVHIQADKKVQYVFGGSGKPYTGMPEQELRKLMQLLDDVPSYNERLDSLALVRAVNALHPLGKDKALDVIDEYLRVASPFDDPGREGVFLVLRALFEPPMPPMMVGAPSPPVDAKTFPLHPLIIIGDVPLKIVSGYVLAGAAERPEDDVAAFRKQGTLRAKPLSPSPSVLDDLDFAMLPGVDRLYVMDQALRFFGTVYRPADRTVDTWVSDRKMWAVHRASIKKLAPVWNARTQQMEVAGKRPLQPPWPARRVLWDLGLKGAQKARIAFERLDDTQIGIEVRIEGTVAVEEISIYKAESAVPLLQIKTASNTVSSQRLKLARGESIRVQVESRPMSPVLTP